MHENKKPTILIAEDDPFFRSLTCDYLKTKNFSVLEANDGRDALQQFRTMQPDLILTDLRMPEISGMQLVEQVVEEAPEIPILIFSGIGTMVDVIVALRAGAWDYIPKPIEKMELLFISINKALERAELLKLKEQQHSYLEQEVQECNIELMRQNKALEREIEKRKTQETMVLQAKQEWERTIDAMPEMIAIIDKEHRVVRVNKTMLNKLGKSCEEFLGTQCYSCVHATDTAPDYCPHRLLLQDGKEHSAEIFDERLGGHCEVVVVPYSDPDGTLIGSVHIVRDINERKRAEREKEKLHARLLQAQKLESVGQLASGIAHEINTPAQFLGSNIDFLDDAFKNITNMVSSIQTAVVGLEKSTALKIQENIQEIDWDYLEKEIPLAINESREGVSRITSIVGAMKEFSHPGGKTKEPTDLNRIIESTVTVARNEWKYVASVETDLATDITRVPCLADEMGQVILNILVNAAQAIASKLGENPEGEKGTIHIRTRQVGSMAELRISDNGCGIPKTVESRIFDPFFTTKEVGKGTGQGLAIARDVIVEKHKGSIEAKSNPDRGTTFIIQLPLIEGGNQ